MVSHRETIATLEGLADLVFETRVSRGLEQLEAARQIGIARSDLQKVEAGSTRAPTLGIILAILRWVDG